MKNLKQFIILLLFFNSVGLHAQQDSIIQNDDLSDESLESLMGDVISGVSRYAQSISEIPNSIQVISRQQIKDRGYHDLSDLLKDVQGFDITSNAGRFGELYSVRGVAGNDRFLVLINGHKLNSASGTFLSIGNSISIQHAERVEVIYGPASAAYGADAFSGIINIVFDNSENASNFSMSASANYASLNTIDASIESSMRVNDDLSFFLSARMYQSEGYDIGGTDPAYDIIENYLDPIANQAQQPIDDHSIYLNASYKNFSLNVYRQQFDEGNAMGHNPAIYIYDKDNRWKTYSNIVWATYEKELSNTGQLAIDISYKNHVQDANTIFHKWKVPGTVGDTYEQYMTGIDNSIVGLITYNQQINDKIQFIIGMDNEFSTSIPPYANDEVLGQSDKYEGSNATSIDNALTIEENRISGFGQAVFTPIDLISITVGARYDYSTRYEGTFNPRIGLIVSPTSNTEIKFIYGKAFQAPSLFYQYEQFGTPTITMLSTAEVQKTEPNWTLENQIVHSFEASVTQRINDNYKIKAVGYYNDLTNLIERNLYSTSVYNKYFQSTTSGLRNENIGHQEIIGGDFLFDAKIGSNILFYSYYSYTQAVSIAEDETETSIPRISEHKAWVGVTAQDLFEHLTISTRFRWVSDMHNANTAVFADNVQTGYYTLDANLSLNNISKYFRIYANFENLLDEDINHGGLYGQSGIYTAVIPQQGFTFKVGIQVFINK